MCGIGHCCAPVINKPPHISTLTPKIPTCDQTDPSIAYDAALFKNPVAICRNWVLKGSSTGKSELQRGRTCGWFGSGFEMFR